jgi:hypothetical protein
MENLHTTTYQSTARADGQRCPVKTDKETGELKVQSAAFYAYNKQNYKSKLQLAMKNPVANSIFEFFVSEMDNTNAICVSMATLEEIFGMKRNALSKHIKYLEANNFISIFKVGNMNAYAVNAYVVWTQGDANIWKAKFSATMYLNYDEQTPKVKREFSKRIASK